MTDLKVFEFEGKEIRTAMIQNDPWWVVKDVCDKIGLSNPSEAVKSVDSDDLSQTEVIDSMNRKQMVNVVNESGLYTLILRSDKPEARRFKKWITSEVIPSIRKTGSYSVPQTIEERSVALISDMLQVIKSQEKKITEDKPKVEFFEAVCSSKDCMDIGSAARALNMGVGRNTLFEFLRQKGVLMSNNQPFQRFVDLGYFRVVEQKFQTPDGEIHINLKTMVYQSGLNYIRNLWGRYLGEKREHTHLVQGA